MTSKELNKYYEKAKTEYLAEIQNDDGSYTCLGCGHHFMTISIHHIIKRSKLKYYYADKRNFIALCLNCHHKVEGIISGQWNLFCFEDMNVQENKLLKEYYNLKSYEKTLLFKYG